MVRKQYASISLWSFETSLQIFATDFRRQTIPPGRFKTMLQQIFRVVASGELESYNTSNGNQSQKRQVRLQEFGGWNGNDNQAARISNGIVATLFGNLAQCMFYPNEVVLATLRFSAREYQGQWYQDVTITDIHKLS